jgi:hypothetical protein
MSAKDTIEKAYGNVPKELPGSVNFFDFIPTRPVKYIWLKWIVRKLFR